MHFDVLVIGGGLAGFSAAIASAEAGARVVILEAQQRPGGATRLSTGMILGAGTRFQRDRRILDTCEDLFRDLQQMSQWRQAPGVVRTLAMGAGSAVEWLADLGVVVEDVTFSAEEATPRAHVTRGGEAIFSAVQARAQQLGVDVVVMARAERLILGEEGVCGVEVNGESVGSRAVVLTCGGYGANYDLLRRWHADPGDKVDIGYVGPSSSRGDVFGLVEGLGVDIVFGHGSRAPTCVFSSAYLPSFALVVNKRGQRFFNEAMSYGVAEALLRRQPGKCGYLIFDDALKRSLVTSKDAAPFFKTLAPNLDSAVLNWRSSTIDDLVERGEVFVDTDLTDVARRWGIWHEGLRSGMARYNDNIVAGEDLDFLKSPAGLRPVQTPPFYSTEVALGKFGLTGAGVRIDGHTRVMRCDGASVRGLFAAGECVGQAAGEIYFGSGASLAAAVVFGRQAGIAAAHCRVR